MFGITRAPEIDRPGLQWFNTEKPLSLAALRGRVVILDFWTFCCINCMHVLPILRRIEEAFPTEVAVIGIHSPKFAAERDPVHLARAIARYGIRHPVVQDPYMALWEDYAVRAWPTLVFLSPEGAVIGQVSGEPDPQALMDGLTTMLRQFAEDAPRPSAALPLSVPLEPGGRLRFPGKIKPCPLDDGQPGWAVADAGHHQIVLFDDAGQERARYGCGKAGLEDGPASAARFQSPQGLACDAEAIWVADTGNHALRRIDRASGHVSTIVGVGQRGPVLRRSQRGSETALASPWDIEARDGTLYIANAGTHQILRWTAAQGMIEVLAGTGGENLEDGPGDSALLAQPSGLALSADGRTLYFADSETSSVRSLSLDDAPQVTTLVGQGLFAFGHQNGDFAQALLQHPLGLAVAEDGTLVVADSYNAVLRRLTLDNHQAEDIAAGDCADALCLPWGEPAGVAAAGPERLLLSDTNNHRIAEIDLARGINRHWGG